MGNAKGRAQRRGRSLQAGENVERPGGLNFTSTCFYFYSHRTCQNSSSRSRKSRARTCVMRACCKHMRVSLLEKKVMAQGIKSNETVSWEKSSMLTLLILFFLVAKALLYCLRDRNFLAASPISIAPS